MGSFHDEIPVNGEGAWWRRLGLDGSDVDQLTSEHLAELGRGPVSCVCLVEIPAA